MEAKDYEVKQKYPCPKNIPEEDWDEEEGKVIRDVRTQGGRPPHRVSHFFKTLYIMPKEIKYNKDIGEKLRKDKNWEYNWDTKRWR